ncbi:MAG: PAS domain S-box protein [Bacteroidales bacterium]|jgi:PAS domain S-box-containing protein|nr:PAS domain S-box protein [Bacteroidales bacterium]
MNYHHKTKDELIIELQKLQREFDSLKTSYEKDIPKHKQAEDKLQESEGKWHKLITAIPAYIALHDIEGRYIYLNHYAEGFSEKDVVGKSLYDFISEDSKEEYYRNFDACLRTKQIQRFVYTAFGNNKTLRIYDSSLIPIIEKQQIINVMAVAMDVTENKKADLELQLQSEIMKNLTEGVFLIKQDNGVIVFTNQKFDEMFGYDHGEMIGINVSIINAPTDKSPEEKKKEIVDIINRTGRWQGEILNIKKNGEHFWCYANVSMFYHSTFGKVYISVHSDITSRKLAESALRESETGFRGVFENSLMGISHSYPVGNLLRINSAYAEMYGYPDISTMLKEVTDLGKQLYFNPDDRNKVLEILDKKGFMEPSEFELKKRNGEKFWALVGVKKVIDCAGKLLYLQAEHLDISKRKKLEEEMFQASLYARNLIEASLDPLVTISEEGKITDTNSATEDITGIKRDKLIGTDFADYFTEPEKAKKGYKIAFSKGIVKDYPLTIVHSNGFKTDVLYNATVFKNEEGEVQGVFAAARDITNLKKMEEELRKSKDLLENLNKHLIEIRENEREVISREIHDQLGQSLTALKIDMTWLRQRITSESEDGKKADEMIELVSTISLDLNRISSELRPLMLDDLGLAAALECYCEEFANRTGLKVQMEIEDVQTENLDKNLSIYRVAQESLTNIIRHADAKKVQIKLYKTKQNIILLIQDDGIGISPDKLRSFKSLGLLGMSERVNQSGGHIEIKASGKGGTKVRVYIPIK